MRLSKFFPMLLNGNKYVWLLPLFLFVQCSKSGDTPSTIPQTMSGEYSGLALYIKSNVQVYVSDFCQQPVWGPLQMIGTYSTIVSAVNDSTIKVVSDGVNANFVVRANGNIVADAKGIINFKLDTKVLTVKDADTQPVSACTPFDQYYYVKQEPNGNPPALKYVYYSIRTWSFEGAK